MNSLPRLPPRAKTWLIVAALVMGAFKLVDWVVEYLWFETLGYTSVFWMMRLLRISLFLLVFSLVLCYFWINFRVLSARLDLGALAGDLTQGFFQSGGVSRASRSLTSNHPDGNNRLKTGSPGLLVLFAIVIALIFGFVIAGYWDTLLRFLWSQPYGEFDPIYGRDIGFYLFELPLLELLQNTLLTATFIASALLAFAYSSADVIRFSWPRGIVAPTNVLWHVAVNLSLFFLALAWGYYLDRFDLLQSSDGAVYGAGYADVYVTRPALWIAAGVSLALAVAVLFPHYLAKEGRALMALGGYLAVLFACLGLAPWSVQSFRVEPNELELEQPYLRHNIAFTRGAYGLDQVDERFYGALDAPTPTALGQNQQTIDNIRLWDWRPLSQTFRQLQQIRSYYAFGDVDVDRYRVGDEYRQVMLAARELSEHLPDKANTWVNRHLQYTHGFGLAMSLTAEKDLQGGPILIIKDLPPRTVGGPSISQPAIYYGETTPDYCIVTTSVKELDYPRGDENVYTHYSGSGGVALDGFWKRLLFAWHQFDLSIVITSYITPASRIQLWRSVRDRITRIAPFLRLDNDPYPVINEGQLYWIQDAYTVASGFPYSEPYAGDINYIRNSVKIVVDAYEGEVSFYVVDSHDPVLGVYRQALPALFKALEEMPEGLRRHLRYPQDLFAAQVAKYSTYHMTVPQVFYNGEDLWNVPREKYGGEVIPMKPYYVLIKLPQEDRLQFLLMTPLTPRHRDNMIAWVAARSDFPDYGELIVYKLPKERLILGPIQVEAMIDQDTLISQQLSLWDQRGSRVIRGNLLVIPIDQSFIYVEPVYLIAEDTDIPQLKRVIVSDGSRLAMEVTLQEALAVVFGQGRRTLEKPPSIAGDARLSEAQAALTTAEQALRDGDWDGFGKAMQELKGLLAE